MPCMELFELQSKSYKNKILEETKFKISIEAASSDCWKKYLGNNGIAFGIDEFGKSAPYKDIYKYFGGFYDNFKNTYCTFFLFLSSNLAFSQSTVNAELSYGSFNYDISGTKYTGDGGVVNLDGQMSSSLNYSLSISDGKFDDVVYNNSEGSVTYMVLPNIGVDFMGSQIKLATVQETDTSLGFSYNLSIGESAVFKIRTFNDLMNISKDKS